MRLAVLSLSLNYRDGKLRMAERSLTVSFESVCRWCDKLGPTYPTRLRRCAGQLEVPGIWVRCICKSTVSSNIYGVPLIKNGRSSTVWRRTGETPLRPSDPVNGMYLSRPRLFEHLSRIRPPGLRNLFWRPLCDNLTAAIPTLWSEIDHPIRILDHI